MALILGDHRSIVVQTRQGNNITNSQSTEVSTAHRNYDARIRSDYPNLIPRSEVSGMYNCHGMVFANRRCWVDKTEDIYMIIADDQYTEISERAAVLPGDIVIYFDETQPIHSGIVVSNEPVLYNPKIVSKFGATSEFVHYANYGPYNAFLPRYYRILG